MSFKRVEADHAMGNVLAEVETPSEIGLAGRCGGGVSEESKERKEENEEKEERKENDEEKEERKEKGEEKEGEKEEKDTLLKEAVEVNSVAEKTQVGNSSEVNEESEENEVHPKAGCCVCGKTEDIKRCGGCKSTLYCSTVCQKSHLSYHQTYCQAITDLMELEKDKIYGDKSVRQKSMDFKMKMKICKLIGRKPRMKCYLDGKEEIMLWDTGSQVSLVDSEWLEEHFPGKELHPVSDFFSQKEINLQAANSSKIDFDGVALLDLALTEEDVGNEEKCLLVPVLVASKKIAEPLLGYNVIEELIMEGDASTHMKLAANFQTTRPFSMDPLIAMVQSQAANRDFLAEVKVPETVTIPAGHQKLIRCRAKVVGNDEEQSVYFWPKIKEDDGDFDFLETVSTVKRGHTNYVYVQAMNQTDHDRVLPKGTVVGSVHSVAAVVPMVRMTDVQKPVEVSVNIVEDSADSSEIQDGEEVECDLSHLTEEQQKQVKEVLWEVRDMFSTSDMDIGDIPDFQMKINVTDDVPVREAYRRIPRNLYSEVKNFVDDLVANGWVRESFSSYASPIVCARKKDGGLRMCVDYRKLNAKTPPDSQPIPRISRTYWMVSQE